MGEMLCKVCGYRGTAGETECPECGAPLKKVEAPAAEPPKASAEVNIIRKAKEKRPHPARRVAVFLALCLVVQSLGLWGLGRLEEQDYLDGGANWSYLYNGELVTPLGVWELDDWVIDMGGNAGPRRVLRSMAALISSQFPPPKDNRYYYDGETLRRTDWSWGALSGDGKVLFYAQKEGEDTVIYRQEGRRGRPQELDRIPGDAAEGVMVAYDGSAVLYVAGDVWKNGDLPVLRQWSEKTGVTELNYEEDRVLVYMGRDGVNKFRLQGFDDSREAKYLVEWGESGRESVFSQLGPFFMDRDLTEVLARSDDGTMVYENQAGERRTVEGFPRSQSIWALVPNGAGALSYIRSFAADRLTDWVYQCEDGWLYYLSEDLTLTDLTPEWKVKDCIISADGGTVYCLSLDDGLYRLEKVGESWDTYKMAEDWGTGFLTAARDLSLIDGKDATLGRGRYAHTLLDTATGEERTVEHSHIGWKGCLLNGGVCWYLDGNELWYWNRETGTAELKLSLDDLGAEADMVEDADSEDWDFALEVVGDGSQAILVRQPKAEDYVFGGGLNGGGPTGGYWLLTADGQVEQLETLLLSED